MSIDFENRKPHSIVFSLSWPIFMELFLQFMLGFMDMFILSHFSDKAVGAVGISNQILQIVTILLRISGTGATILIAQNLGANNKEKAAGIGFISILLNLIIGCIFAPLLFFFSPFWVNLMNCPEELFQYSVQYLSIIGGTIMIRALFLSFSAILYSYGHTKESMLINLASNIINTILSWLVIFSPFGFPVLGVPGVAWATVIGSFIGLILITIFFIKKLQLHAQIKNIFSSFKDRIWELIKLGFPVSLEQLLYNVSQVMITAFVGFMGAIAVSTRIYANTIMWMMEMLVYCIGLGLQIYTARLIGMGKRDEVEKICFKMVRTGWIINFTFPVLVYFFSDYVFGIFTKDLEILSIAKILMALAIVVVPSKVMPTLIGFTLKSAGDVNFGVIMSLVFMLGVSVPLAYFVGVILKWGLPGIWMVAIFDETVRGFFTLARFKTGKWKLFNLVKQEAAL